jgi:excinuclease ABC subunit A
VIETLLERPADTRVVLLAPRGRGPSALGAARRDGFVRARVAGKVVRLEDVPDDAAGTDDLVEVVVDRLVVREGARSRFAEAVEQGFRVGEGVLVASVEGGDDATFADRPFCAPCGVTYPPLSPNLFSFDSPAGACPACQGVGSVPRLDPERVLPRDERIGRATARVLAAVAPADRPAVRRAVDRAAKRAKAGRHDRVATLPEEARTALLGSPDDGAGDAGLLALLLRRDRWERFSTPDPCRACGGGRLAPFPAAARLAGTTLPDLARLSVAALRPALSKVALKGADGALAKPVRDDVVARLRFLEEVGLGYLALDRAAGTLSGGELRRARLAAACAARMSGLLFLLDEPTAGLHPADRAPLRRRLRGLVTEGNTVVCVEHDPAVLEEADHVVELGPGAGTEGGRILAEGPAKEVAAGKTPMARALARRAGKPLAASRAEGGATIRLRGARFRNLQDADCSFPVGGLTTVTGVSGAGKSTLALDVLAVAARAVLARAPFPKERCASLEGLDGFDRVAVSDGAPPRHPRATAGGVLGALPPIRDLFAATVEARARGYGPSRFSTGVKGGRCEACRGLGRRSVRLRHLPEATAPCDACGGTRFSRETLAVRVKGLSIAEVLDLPIERAAAVFRDLRGAGPALRAAADVGLGYVPLGETTDRLSGGEALRLRLASALGRAGRSRTLYVLDEPCAGLHPDDVAALSKVLLRLAAEGNAVVCVEHHADLVRLSDHVVEIGPGPGEAGGRVVVEGTPADVAATPGSPTGRFLR